MQRAALVFIIILLSIHIPAPDSIHIVPMKTGYVVLDNTSYNVVFSWSSADSIERTGNTGVTAYSWVMDAYITAWVRETDTNHIEGDLYVYVWNATSPPDSGETIQADSSGGVKGVDTVVAGRRSLLVGYTRYGNRYDAYAVLVKWGGTGYTSTQIPLGDTGDYEEYVSAGFLGDRYLTVYYDGSDEYLYGVIVYEDGSTQSIGKLAYTGLAYNDNNLGFTVIPAYDHWTVFYTSSDGKIHAVDVTPSGSIQSSSLPQIQGTLYTSHGGAYTYGEYLLPYISPSGEPSIAILDGSSSTTYTLTTSGTFPLLIDGNRYALVVWKDTASDTDGNVYGKLVYPWNKSVSATIDIGRDYTNSYSDGHIFTAYNYANDTFIIVWDSQRSGDSYKTVYASTLSEAGSLGSVSRLYTGLAGDYYPHGVASGRDGRVCITSHYYPTYRTDSDAQLVYGDLGRDVEMPPRMPVYSVEAAFYGLPDDGRNAVEAVVDLLSSANHSVIVSAYRLGYSDSIGDTYVAGWFVEAMVKAYYRIGGNVSLIVDDGGLDRYDVAYASNYIPVYHDSSSYPMHHKVIVVDDEYLALSTANFHRYCFMDNRNILVILHSPEIASRFTAEYSEMMNGVFHGGPPTQDPSFTAMINGTLSRVWVYFSPDDYPDQANTLLGLVGNASRSLNLMMFAFTNNTIAQALVNDSIRGVDVRVLMEAGEYWEIKQYSVYDDLVENDVLATLDKDNDDPSSDNWYPLFHVKSMIVDHSIVYFGSAQFTGNGFKHNDEYLVVINNTMLARWFERYFNEYWTHYTSSIMINAAYTNNTPAAGVHSSTNETYKSRSYERRATTGPHGNAALYLVYPYANNTVSETVTVKTMVDQLYIEDTVTLSTGSSITLHYYLTPTRINISGPSIVNVGSNTTYTVYLINTSTGQPAGINTVMELYINGSYNGTVNISMGTGEFTIHPETPGTINITLKYNGDTQNREFILPSTNTTTVRAEGQPPPIPENPTLILIGVIASLVSAMLLWGEKRKQ